MNYPGGIEPETLMSKPDLTSNISGNVQYFVGSQVPFSSNCTITLVGLFSSISNLQQLNKSGHKFWGHVALWGHWLLRSGPLGIVIFN